MRESCQLLQVIDLHSIEKTLCKGITYKYVGNVGLTWVSGMTHGIAIWGLIIFMLWTMYPLF